ATVRWPPFFAPDGGAVPAFVLFLLEPQAPSASTSNTHRPAPTSLGNFECILHLPVAAPRGMRGSWRLHTTRLGLGRTVLVVVLVERLAGELAAVGVEELDVEEVSAVVVGSD